MRRIIAATMAATALGFAVSLSSPVMAADADPSMHQIYEAAAGGHLDQAQTMIEQVLKDHPKSAKAHYVQAELFAKEGKLALARTELSQAETLDPGLPFAKPQSLAELKSQLGGSARPRTESRTMSMGGAPSSPHIPWGLILIVAAVVGLLWMVFRRRPGPVAYSTGGPGVAGGPGGYGAPMGPGGYGGPAQGGGMGSGIVGGLASGLAVGAGVVAGEEIAHRFMDGGRHEGTALPPNDDSWQSSNSDMGGTDFGTNDSGSSWDDGGSGGGGGGGDDWT